MIDELKKFARKLPTHFLKSVHLDEVSLVDNPANQETHVTIYKRETPVNSTIWKEDTEEDEDEEKTEKMGDHKDKDEEEEKEVEKIRQYLRKMKEEDKDDDDEDEKKEVSKRRMRRRLRKSYVPAMSYDTPTAEFSPEMQNVMKRMAATVDSQADQLAEMREDQRRTDVLHKSQALASLPAPLERTAELVDEMSKSLTEREFGRWYDYMQKLAKSIEILPLAGELGSSMPNQTGAAAELEKLAMQQVSKSAGMTKEQAITKILEEQPHLYEQILMEERNG